MLSLLFVSGVFFGARLSLFIHLFTQLPDVHGNLFSIRLGGRKVVFAYGYKMVEEVILTQADKIVKRPYEPFADQIYMGQKGMQKSQYLVDIGPDLLN